MLWLGATINLMKPKINKTSEYIEIVGHYDNSVLCAKLTLLADLYAIEHREGYAKFRIEDEDKLDLVNEKLDYEGQLYIYSNNGQTLLKNLDYGPFICTITSTGTSIDGMGHNYTYSGSQTFLGFSITANATVPDSDLEVGDSFRIRSNKTVYIVEGSSSPTITDLTGTKWKYVCTSGVSMSGPPAHVSSYSINGTINNQNFTGIDEVSKSSAYFYFIGSYYFSKTTTGGVVNGTIGDEYIIEITGGTDATNTDLIAWLQANATQITEPEITDLTGTKWLINSEPVLSPLSSKQYFTINYKTGQKNCQYIGINEQIPPMPAPVAPEEGSFDLYYYDNEYPVYQHNTSYSRWTNEEYRIIEITGGTDATNSDLIAWLQANATQVQIGPAYTLSITTDNCEITNLSFTLVPNSGYQLPSSISVTNATLVSYNSTSGEVILSGVGDNTSVDVEFNAVNLITFKINSTSYQAEDGMTWGEWCNSTHNTDGFRVLKNIITRGSYGQIQVAGVKSTDTILSGGAYHESASGGSCD